MHAMACRCPGCFNNSDQDALLDWTAEMSAFLKCIDPHHLVSGEGGMACDGRVARRQGKRQDTLACKMQQAAHQAVH